MDWEVEQLPTADQLRLRNAVRVGYPVMPYRLHVLGSDEQLCINKEAPTENQNICASVCPKQSYNYIIGATYSKDKGGSYCDQPLKRA